MALIPNRVLLLKAEKSDGATDKYEELLKSYNFEVISIKTLSFKYCNIETLTEKLLKPDHYSGIVFSSPRCVEATHRALTKDEIQGLWNLKHNFVVGETTEKECEEKLGLKCQGKEAGNIANLLQLINQDKPKFSRPFLYPCGNLRIDSIKDDFHKADLQIDNILVYETASNPTVGNEFQEATSDYTRIPQFVIFFSPSGVQSSVQYLRKIPLPLNTVKFIAIGPTTETALKRENLTVFKVAKSPTPQEILNTLTM